MRRRLRNLVWTAFVTVLAAYIVSFASEIGFVPALLIVLFLLAIATTVWDELESGDIRFWLRHVRRRRLKQGTIDALGFVARACPQSPTGSPAIAFQTTEAERLEVSTLSHPVGVSFHEPIEQDVGSRDVPCRLKKAGLTIFRVERFTDSGFVITEQRPGIFVRGDVSYQK